MVFVVLELFLIVNIHIALLIHLSYRALTLSGRASSLVFENTFSIKVASLYVPRTLSPRASGTFNRDRNNDFELFGMLVKSFIIIIIILILICIIIIDGVDGFGQTSYILFLIAIYYY